MKYVSRFNKFIKESYGSNPSINWELIDTAKDLALEHLDEGLNIKYSVWYKEPESETPGPFKVLEGKFSHDGDDYIWYEWQFEEDEILNSENIYYNFCLSNNTRAATYKEIQNLYKSEHELINHLREVYPSEKINL